MAGGIGAKKVDVTWTTEESGLLLAISIKSINFADKKTGNYQKNLTNRRGDMLYGSGHPSPSFPLCSACGILLSPRQGCQVGWHHQEKVHVPECTHARLKLFTGRNDPAGM